MRNDISLCIVTLIIVFYLWQIFLEESSKKAKIMS